MKTHSTFASIVAITLFAAGCTTASVVPDTDNRVPVHNARNALDWSGAYRGVLPCADCQGIETVVVLASDGTYETLWKYRGKGDEVF